MGFFGYDDPEDKVEVAKLAEAYAYRDKLTKSERLKLMWKLEGFEGVSVQSPELAEVSGVVGGSLSFGFIYGSITCGTAALHAFKEQNKQTMFLHPREAQKLASQQAMYHMARGGTIFAIRYGVFAFTYMATAQSLGVAYNRVSPGDHMIAGALTGALYRLPSGWRPAMASGILGSGMGLAIGFGFWVAHLWRGGDVGSRWVDRYEREKKVWAELQESKRKELEVSGKARPADCDETLVKKGLENIDDPESIPRQAATTTPAENAALQLDTEVPKWNEDAYIWNRVVNRIRGYMGGAANPIPDYVPEKWDKAPEDMREHDWMFKKPKKQ